MSLVTINWRPAPRQLRQFGLIAAAALPALGWLWGADGVGLAVLAATGLAAGVLGLVRPTALRPVFVALCVVTLPIGLVVSEVVVALMFWAVFVPVGLAFRLLGRDELRLRPDPTAATYWQPKPQPRGPESYLRQS